jgi:hypothetical protein
LLFNRGCSCQFLRGVLRRAVPAVLARQRTDGSFGSTAQQEPALIALRALIWVEQEG